MEIFGCSRHSVIAGIMAVAAAVIFTAADVSARNVKRDASGHILVSEWKKLDDAVKKDLPETQKEILEDIIGKSVRRGLSWDFYSAANAYYCQVRLSDWKKAEAAAEMIAGKADELGDIVVTWNLAKERFPGIDMPSFREVAASGAELSGRETDQFYKEMQDRWTGSRQIPEFIAGSIGNDYEYMLWEMLGTALVMDPADGMEPADSSVTFAEAERLLEEYYGGRYPQTAYIEYLGIRRITDDCLRMKALEGFMKKYSGRGIRFYAGADILGHRFDSLSRVSASSSGFKSFREECEAFEKERKAEKTDSRLVRGLESVKEIIDRMDFRRISAWIQDNTDTLKVSLQNVVDADVRIFRYRGSDPFPELGVSSRQDGSRDYGSWADSTLVLQRHLENTAGSYYVPDTLSVPVTGFDDLNYYVICEGGGVSAAFPYRKRTVSVACRYQDGSVAVYAAGSLTGKPVDTADISVFRNDSLVRRLENVPLDGFTPIASGLTEGGRYSLQCSYTDDGGIFRQSGRIYFTNGPVNRAEEPVGNGLSCLIFKNMAAFNPGDTLKYKTVVYRNAEAGVPDAPNGWKSPGYRVVDEGYPVVAELLDVAGNVVASDTLRTGGMGSAAGTFILPEDSMNGRYTLRISADGKILASSVLTVDDFILPTFGISFEPVDRIYFPGDTVTVRGRIESYAGQSLAACAVTYGVSLWNGKSEEGTLDAAGDGSFSIRFIAGDGKASSGYFYHNVTVKVVDATGETHESSCGVAVWEFDLDVDVENEADSYICQAEGASRDAEADSADVYRVVAIDGNFAVVTFNLRNASFTSVDEGMVKYSVIRDGETVCEAETAPGGKVWIDLSSWPSGTFRLRASVRIRNVERVCVCDLVKTSEGDDILDIPLENFFKIIPSDGIKVQFGAASGPVWAVVQLFGGKDTCLHSEIVHLEGGCGKPGSLKTLSYGFASGYPDVVKMEVFYFRNGRAYTFSHDFERKGMDLSLPLIFTRFTDKAYPGEKCLYEIMTAPGAECAVSVFDMATEVFRANVWNRLEPERYFPYPRLNYITGMSSGYGASPMFRLMSDRIRVRGTADGRTVYGYGPVLNAGLPTARLTSEKAVYPAAAEAESEEVMMTKSADQALMDSAQPAVREDFASGLAFYPSLRADDQGRLSFSFTAGDKLSTYYVSVFAHDRNMANAVLRQKVLVTLPVTVSVAQPAYLYAGDRYVMQVSLSNVSGEDSEGILSMFLYDGSDYEGMTPSLVTNRPVEVARGSAEISEFSIEVPEDTDTLGIKVIYRAHDGVSDGLFVTVPVRQPEQTLYESHSALLLDGMDRDSLYAAIMEEFVNVSGYGAVSREISIADMLRDAVPDSSWTSSPDVLSVAGAYFSARIASSLNGGKSSGAAEESGSRLLSFQNAGGGFSWLKGGPSSPSVTAAVLEYIALLDRKHLLEDSPEMKSAAAEAVDYIDRYYFSADKLAGWAGGISLQQYLYIRSMYGTRPLAVDPGRKERKAFARQVKDYLYGKGTDPAGYILYKARRAGSVLNFLEAGDSGYLSSIGIGTNRKLASALDRYSASLVEYAAAHPSGGVYYPNAVMPFRGLLESELYAHVMICDLMDRCGKDKMADGIRLWIMIQKETQDWKADPAYMMALDAVSAGSPGLLASKVLILTRKYRKPFDGIEAAGNGLSVQCRYFVEDRSAGKDSGMPGYREIKAGEILGVGDKVMAVYDLWSAENRSFVRLTAPRYAAMRPLGQLSGPAGPVLRRISSPGYPVFTPYSYREVKADRSIWYFDVLAEEKTRITESLVVTQAGEFVCPVPEIVCMYAPHYRANDGFGGQLAVSRK